MNQKVTKIIRILLGSMLVIFGANKFINFMPAPENMSEAAAGFMKAIMDTGYLFKFIGLVEIISGILLLTNKWTPFALLIIAPVILNIIMFHLVLDVANIIPGAIIFIMLVFLFCMNRNKFSPLFKA